jgi:ferredoxin-NADP reductase
MRVAEVRAEGPGVVSVFITGNDLRLLQTESGQFFRWRFLTRDLWWAANPYSLSAPAREDFLRITVKVAGAHSAALAQLRPGTKVFAEGPYGAFTEYRRRQPKVLLIGGGVGITPLRALFETIPADPGKITLLYRAERAEDLVLRGELEAIARDRGATVRYLLGPPGQGIRDPLSAASLRRLVPDITSYDVFVCGPEGMMTAARDGLRLAGVKRRRIHHESFTF